MRSVYILMLAFGLSVQCMGKNDLEQQVEFNRRQANLKKISVSIQPAFDEIKKGLILLQHSAGKSKKGYVSLLDAKKREVLFKDTALKRDELSKLLHKELDLKNYRKEFGFSLGGRESYVGDLLCQNWNLVVQCEEKKGLVFVKVKAFFKPPQNTQEDISKSHLIGFILLESD